MRKIIVLLLCLPLSATAQFKEMLKKAEDKITTTVKEGTSGNTDISAGLKEALNKGVSNQVSKLTAVDGFLKNEAVKVLFPEELQQVDQTLRKMGMANLADEGIKVLNRAAEDAVKEATPIFTQAITSMSISDAKGILMGKEDAATQYLQTTTTTTLYSKFRPVVEDSFRRVGADKVWEVLISKYNAVPMVSKVNPDLNDYVTTRALEGVFTMIAVEEKDIRTNLNSRTSDLLKKVFALQD